MFNHNLDMSIEGFSPLLKQLLTNAKTNVDKRAPQAKRHNTIIKKFSTSLFIYAGPRVYSFLHENMPQALPSLRTIQRVVQSEYKHIGEGEYRFDDLVVHFESCNMGTSGFPQVTSRVTSTAGEEESTSTACTLRK